MKNDFYQEERIHHIYMIYNPYEGSAYIGKTYSSNPRSRVRAHIRGDCQLTADDLSWRAIDPDDIGFRLLESLPCTGSDAYRHVVAWCLFFEEQGVLMLNPAGTVQATENLHPQTKAIYDSVCAPFSLEQVLTREVLPLQPSPDNIDYDTLPFRHLSIRVPEDTLDAFKEFCAEQNLTQKDALRLLLLSQEDLCCQKLTASIQNEFAKKDAIIADLESVIGKKRAQIQRTRERSRVIAATCQQYVREMISHVPAPTYPKLKALSFKTAKRTLDFSSYLYPTTSGYEYFQLEHLVYGRGCASALFALGRNAVGDKIKLRWYDRDSYVGTRFKWSSRAYKGSPWLVGYTVAPDGATDLVVALPLGNAEAVACKEATPHTAPALHPSIDEIISAAEKGAK